MIALTSQLRAQVPAPWRRALLPFAGLLVAIVVLYLPTAQAMVAVWSRSETFTHAFVVPPIVLWLVWRKRFELRRLAPQPQPWMLLALAAMAVLWMLGDLAAANVVTQFAFTAMLVLSVPAVLGRQVTQVILFPLVFLFYAVPAGESLTPIMMQWTADFTVKALRVSGIPVYREGLQFVIPSGSWSVVEACSGIRYLIASFMVGSLFAYLNYRSFRRQLAFVAVSIVLPIVANWLRAYMIVMLGHLSNNQIAVGADHLLYGWVFFGIVIIGMFFIGARWAEPDLPTPAGGTGELEPAATAARAWSMALAAALMLLAPHFLLSRLVEPMALSAPALSLPAKLSEAWVAGPLPLTDWKPVFAEPSAEATQTYMGPGGPVAVHLAYYRGQNDDRKLVGSRNMLVRSTDFQWNLLKSDTLQVPLADAVLTMRSAELLGEQKRGGGERQRLLVWRLYWIGGHVTTSDVMAKLLSAWQRLNGQGDESAALLIYAAEATPGAAVPVLESFMRANWQVIDQGLRGTARSREGR